MKNVGFSYHPIYLDHQTGRFHPERSSRLEAILRQLKKDGLDSQMLPIEAYEASIDWIKEIHDESYIKRVYSACQAGESFLDTEDCPISPKTYEASIWSAGGVLAAVDHVMEGLSERAFCAVRPPGHHAEQSQAMGFCFFNNIAIAARYLQKKFHLERVFILDWDVHHGNGTQHSFANDPSVFYCSLHEDPRHCYPGTGYAEEIGLGNGKGYTLNCPIAPMTEEEVFLETFETQVLTAIEKFKPDFILISAGFDGHKDDPLAHLNLTEMGYGKMTDSIVSLANAFCKGRVVSVLEGGYNLLALGNSVSTHIQSLMK